MERHERAIQLSEHEPSTVSLFPRIQNPRKPPQTPDKIYLKTLRGNVTSRYREPNYEQRGGKGKKEAKKNSVVSRAEP